MDSIKNLNWRYATKKFDHNKILTESKINILKESFRLTATSYGLQPLKMVVISNKTLQEKLQVATYNQKQIGTASHVLVLCIEKTIDTSYINKIQDLTKEIRNTPDTILEPYRNFLIDMFEKKPTAEIATWATNQVYLALGNLLTVCAQENIDACPMEGFEPKKYNDILKLDQKGLQATLVLPIGYRATDDFFADLKKVRRPLNEVVLEITE